MRKDQSKKDPRDQRHGKWLHQPVDEQGHQKAPRPLPDVADRGKVDLHHHRYDHQPDQDGNGDVDLAAAAEFHPPQAVDGSRHELAEDDADNHAGADPQAQVSFEDIQPFRCDRNSGSTHIKCSPIPRDPTQIQQHAVGFAIRKTFSPFLNNIRYIKMPAALAEPRVCRVPEATMPPLNLARPVVFEPLNRSTRIPNSGRSRTVPANRLCRLS